MAVPLNPGAAVDFSLQEMTLEETFEHYHVERVNTPKKDREKPASIHCRHTIKGLPIMLRFLARNHRVSVAEYNVCISPKVLSELQSMPELVVLRKGYDDMLKSGVRRVMYDHLAAISDGYRPIQVSVVDLQLYMFPEVQSAIVDLAQDCGTTPPKLYQVGLASAIASSDYACKGGDLYRSVSEILLPEKAEFVRHIDRWYKSLSTVVTRGL